MKRISMLAVMGMMGLLAPVTQAQTGAESTGRTAMLQSLERPGEYESRRSSSADPNWKDGNGDCRPVKPGETLTLAELDGPGRITHIWFTISAEDKFYPRTMSLRIYWDGREQPSVESPIGDFFAVGHGLDVPVNSMPVAVSSDGRARNCYWPMPFAKSAKITVTNDSADKNVGCIFWYIDWQKLPSLPEDTMYFHAQYRQEFPAKMGQDYLFLDAEGDGAYVGTVYSVDMVEDSWFGEGDDRFYIDGAKEPQLNGTGTEDYFCDAWGFRKFNNPFYGVSVWEGYSAGDHGTAYRWHVPDPVRFRRSLKVTIEHKGVLFNADGSVKTGFAERPDNLSSVAFWYQRGVAKRFATLPPGPERIVPTTYLEMETRLTDAKTQDGAARPEVQKGDQWSGKAQLFWQNTDPKAWIEVPFSVPEDGRYLVKLDLTRSFDYGIWQVLIDNKKIGSSRDLYNATVVVQPENLGGQELKKGDHMLRFECIGSNPQSKHGGTPGYFFGLDGIVLRKVLERK